MSWLEKRKRYRIRDVIGGQRCTPVKDLGLWREAAEAAHTDYKKAKTAGFVIDPDHYNPTLMTDIRNFLKAKAAGQDVSTFGRPIPIEKMLDLYVETHGPSRKGGVTTNTRSSFYVFKNHISVLKKAWAGRMSDEITSLDVRDFLARPYYVKSSKKTGHYNVGGVMKYLRVITHIFKAVAEWNEEEILKPPVKLPLYNPGTQWRKKMKPAQKREIPDTRVLSEDEWHTFHPHLTARAYAICDMALRRFLRRSDIKALTETSDVTGRLEGLQRKTGDRYSLPTIGGRPATYDFTNFEREFRQAQIDAGMHYPAKHPLHFSLRTLRRTGATWAYRSTKDLVGISKMLGHRSIATTILYLGLDETDLVQIAEAVDRKAASRSKRGGEPVGNSPGMLAKVITK